MTPHQLFKKIRFPLFPAIFKYRNVTQKSVKNPFFCDKFFDKNELAQSIGNGRLPLYTNFQVILAICC